MPRQVTAKMQLAYDLRLSGKLEPEIAKTMGVSLKGAFQLISRCRALGMELPRRRYARGMVKPEPTNPDGKLPSPMPSKKIPRCPDCQLMLSSEGSCIDCPADRRRMLVLLTNQRSTSGTLVEIQEEAIDMGDLKDIKAGVRRLQSKYPDNGGMTVEWRQNNAV